MNLEKVFDFIKDRRGYDYPFVYKLVNGLPISENELTVDGDLRKTRISVLPDNLYVGGSLDLDGLLIEELPNNLHVGRYLSIMVTPIGRKYSGDDIKKMIKDKGGVVYGRVYVG